MSFLSCALAIARKDLLTELRSKERLSSMGFFAVLMLLVFSVALTPGSQEAVIGAPGIFWAAVILSGLFGLTRSFTLEQTNDSMLGLLLAPIDRGAIYLGKMLANLVTLLALEALLLPLFAVMLNVDVGPALPRLLPVLLLGTFGYCSVGTLFSAMSASTRLKEAMMPLLTLPVLIPALLAAVEGSRAVLGGEPLSAISDWLKISVAFCLMFFVLCLILFDYVVEE